MDSGQFGRSGNQQFQQGPEQALAPDAGVMHELEEAQVERQFFLAQYGFRAVENASL